MAHLHEVKDKDLRFELDENLNIINLSELRPLRRGDHNSEIISFAMPRYFEGHDMSLCNVRQVHYNNVYADRFETKTNASFDDLQGFEIDPEDENKIVFYWQVQGDATELEGALDFSLLFECTNDAGEVEYRKLTEAFTALKVGNSILNTEAIARKYADVLAAWKAELEAKVENATVSEEHVAAAVSTYMEENPIEGGATEEQLAQIAKNTEDISKLSETVNEKLDADKLPEAINTALAQAKESGEFDGKDGQNGYTPQKGTDYFTNADKQELVTDLLNALPTWTGGSY